MRTHATTCVLHSALIVLLTLAGNRSSAAQNAAATQTAGSPTETLTADHVVAAMMLRNQSRAAALSGYTGRRTYRLSYHGFPGSQDAELIVEARYSAPSTKQFSVISQSGSRVIVDKVLKRLLASEEEAQSPDNQQQTALTPRNYLFELQGEEVTDQGRLYLLNVQPRTNKKFLFRGKIWVDPNDFAIVRVEAEPAKNPSFWISQTRIEQQYAKFGSFWLPVRNQSTSKVRLGGTATLVIEYQGYQLSADARNATVPPANQAAARSDSAQAAFVPSDLYAGSRSKNGLE